MTIKLLRSRNVGNVAVPAGAVISLDPATEGSLVASGQAQFTAEVVTWTPASGAEAALPASPLQPASYNWASRPSAAASGLGSLIRIADVGAANCGSLWMSNGASQWVPQGNIVLAQATGSVASPLSSLTAVGKFSLPNARMVGGSSVILHSNLLRMGLILRVVAKFRHIGTAGAWRVDSRLGTLNSASDNAVGAVTGTATTDQTIQLWNEATVVSGTSFWSDGYSVYNSPTTGGYADRTTNFNITSTLFAGLYLGVLAAGDQVDLLSYRVELVGA